MEHASTDHASTHRTRAASAPAAQARVDGILALYRTHYTNLVRLAFLLVGDRDVAIRVVDESFARLGRARVGHDGTVPAAAQLRGSVVANARDHVPVRASSAAASGTGPSDERRSILDALYTLPHAQREGLVLQHYGALSDDDLVIAAGAPIGAVRANASEGLRGLHHALGGRDT